MPNFNLLLAAHSSYYNETSELEYSPVDDRDITPAPGRTKKLFNVKPEVELNGFEKL